MLRAPRPVIVRWAVHSPGVWYQTPRGRAVVAKPAEAHWRILPALNSMIADSLKQNDSSVQWSSLQINIDTASTWHADAQNLGWSAILALGSFTGGRFALRSGDRLWNTTLLIAFFALTAVFNTELFRMRVVVYPS